MSGWPELERRVEKILAQLLDEQPAVEVARMIANIAAGMVDGRSVPSTATAVDMGVWSWPVIEEAADPGTMTDEERQLVALRFKAGDCCPHCGGIHLRACPRVKRFVFRGDGDIAEVEFWPPGQWPTDQILMPEDFPVDSE